VVRQSHDKAADASGLDDCFQLLKIAQPNGFADDLQRRSDAPSRIANRNPDCLFADIKTQQRRADGCALKEKLKVKDRRG
jgi:hypothetical protein